MSNVIAFPAQSFRLTRSERDANLFALLRGGADHIDGIYCNRRDVRPDAEGWLLVPCEDCSKPVRTLIDHDAEGAQPTSHPHDEGAYYEQDMAVCPTCVAICDAKAAA